MDIRQLKYFIAIVKFRNISHAAKSLYITQSTLSLALKKIETEIGAPVFTHEDGPFQLTDLGELIYNHAIKIVQAHDQLQSDIQHFLAKEEKEKLTLGITTLFAAQFMASISDFLISHPKMELEIIQGGSKRLQEAIVDESIDIGLLSLPNYHPELIDFRPLQHEIKGYHVHVVVPNTNPLAKKVKIQFKDLRNERFSSLNEDYMLGVLLPTKAKEYGFKPNIIMYHEDVQVMLLGLSQSQSICLLPIEYKDYMNGPNVTWVPLDDEQNYYPIGIATSKTRHISKSMQDLMTLIYQQQ